MTRPYRYNIPIPSDGALQEVEIAGMWPLTPDQWDYFIRILNLYRAGLVEEPEAEHVDREVEQDV